MPTTTLDLPEPLPYATELEVRIGDINYGGHLGNDALLRLLHEARLRFLAEGGMSEADIGGVGLIMADAVLLFKSPAFHRDPLRIEVGVGDMGRAGFDFLYRVSHRGDGREIARAKTAMAGYDYTRNKIARLPEKFRRFVKGEDGSGTAPAS